MTMIEANVMGNSKDEIVFSQSISQCKKIKKLTVNTCSLDHKSAIYLYQKYGFRPVKYKDLEKTV